MADYKLPEIANRRVVIDGVQTLIRAYRAWLKEQKANDVKVDALDRQMIAHNFHKAILYRMVDEMIVGREILMSERPAARRELLGIAIATLQAVLDQGTHENGEGIV